MIIYIISHHQQQCNLALHCCSNNVTQTREKIRGRQALFRAQKPLLNIKAFSPLQLRTRDPCLTTDFRKITNLTLVCFFNGMKLCTFHQMHFSQLLHKIWQGNPYSPSWNLIVSQMMMVSLPNCIQKRRKMHLMKSATFHPIEKARAWGCLSLVFLGDITIWVWNVMVKRLIWRPFRLKVIGWATLILPYRRHVKFREMQSLRFFESLKIYFTRYTRNSKILHFHLLGSFCSPNKQYFKDWAPFVVQNPK